MSESTTATVEPTEETAEDVVDESTADGAKDDLEPDPEGTDALGDKGKKALDAMKEREKAARAEARTLKQRVAELEAAAAAKDKTPDEQALDAAKREAAAEATAKANARILRSEVKVAAAGKLTDPADALRLLDLDEFEVDENGDVDADQINDAISDLIKSKPYLAAQSAGVQFDSGRGKRARPSQLTRADLKGMRPDAIKKAREEGRLDDLLGAGKS